MIAPANKETEALTQRLIEARQKLDDQLTNSRIEAIRKEEELVANARKEEETISAQLAAAGARLPPPHNFGGHRKRTHEAHLASNVSTIRTIDAWIFEPFKEATGTTDINTALVLMASLPKDDVKFNGDSKQWPMFIQTVKNMVHDVTPFNAQRINLVRNMLHEDLQRAFGQILSSPLTYQQALQDLWSWYGRPHLVVQAYIRDLRSIPPLKEYDIEALGSFQQRLHGAICSLQTAGYGHELTSSIALSDLVEKLPDRMASGWGKHVHKLFFKYENRDQTGI